jgi:hypothetical protein
MHSQDCEAVQMRKGPPCKQNGVLCDKHMLGCRTNCEQYQEWEAEHIKERDAMNAARDVMYGVDDILIRRNYKRRLASKLRRLKGGRLK